MNNEEKEEKIKKAIKIGLVAIVIIFAYLYLLNDRYVYDDRNYAFDKWRVRMIEIDWPD